jgi:hypothetical protein
MPCDDVKPLGHQTPLGRETLLNLLQTYEGAISQLQSSPEPKIRAFRLRLERRQADVIAELAKQVTRFEASPGN